MKLYILILFFLFTTSCNFIRIKFEQIPNNITLKKSTNFLKINPYKNAPLSAELHLLKPLKESFTITVKGQDGKYSDLSYTWHSTTNNIFPLLGLYFDHTNTVILSTPSKKKIIHIIITNKPPEYIQSINIITNNRPMTSERQNFLNFINPVGKLTDLFGVDNYGKIRWYLKSSIELHGMKFKEKNNEMTFSILNTKKPEIITYNMRGKVLSKIKGPLVHTFKKSTEKRFHHDMFFRKNGNILVLDKSEYGVEDVILELDSEGNVVEEILIGDWIRKTINHSKDDNSGLENFIYDSSSNQENEYSASMRYPGMPQKSNAIDWAHINAISFDEITQTLYLSFRQHGIFAFDYQNKILKWIFIRNNYTMPTANKIFYNLPDDMHYIYEIPALKPYILKGASGPDHPHAITYLGNNQFMVFDNSGNDGSYPEEGSRLLVFSVDEISCTVHIDWEYRHKDPITKLLYSQIVSDIDKSPFNSYIGVFGSTVPFSFIEIDIDKSVLFDMKLYLTATGSGNSDISMPIACPTSRLIQNGILVYRGDYQPIHPNKVYSID